MMSLALGCAIGLLSTGVPHAAAQPSQAIQPASGLTPVPTSQTVPPVDHELPPAQAIAIAKRSHKIRDELRRYGRTRIRTYAKGPNVWQVSWFDADDKEVAQAVVDERGPRLVEAWTGVQVAWQMARGEPGAFGRKASAAYVWVSLMVVGFFGLFDWRKPLRIEHLDLLVLLSFSGSQFFFNRGEIDTSVPLVYPVLAYLLARMLAVGFRGAWRGPGGSGSAVETGPTQVPGGQGGAVPLTGRFRSGSSAWRPSIPTVWLALALIFLVGFRIALNVADSNVIDVGYSGVIGADRVTHAISPYGNFPGDDPSGDTYGPLSYYTYVPFETAFPWRGRWDDLPAAHGAAILFDLATIVGLLVLGRRLRRDPRAGWRLGVSLAFAWAAFPYTLYVLNSNANDSLVAALVVLCLIVAASPRARGAALALAGAAKFAALTLVPLFATYADNRLSRAVGYSHCPTARDRRARDAITFGIVFVFLSAVLWLPLLPDGGPREIYDRTVGYQLGRSSPFSIWGLHPGLEWLQTSLKVAGVGLALLVAWLPRRKTLVQLAALSAAVLIALQLTLTHWFYLYIVWWLPLVLVALLAREPVQPESSPKPESTD
jgi:hypothetical protein